MPTRTSIAILLVLLNPLTAWTQDETAWAGHKDTGWKAYQEGRYAEAEKFLLAASKEAKHFGEQDPRLALSLTHLALLYQAQGKYAEAEPLYQRSLAIIEKALGPQHPNVATSLENYAVLLRKTERNVEADRLEKRARAIRAKPR